MNNRLRLFLSAAMILMLALGVAAPLLSTPERVSAQGPFECPLAEEDCAILFNALEAAPTLSSVNVDGGSLVLDMDLGADSATSINLDLAGPIMINAEDATQSAADLTVTGEMVSPDETDSLDMHVIVVDGMSYSYDAETEEWTVEEVDAEDMTGLDLSGLDLASIFDVINQLSAIEGVVVWERSDDMEGLAVFTVDIRLGELLVAPEFAVMLGGVLDSMGDESLGIDSTSLSMIIGMLGGQIKPQLDEGTFQLTLAISPEDNYIHGLTFNLDLNLDLAFLAALAGGEMSIPPIAILTIVDAHFSQHNETFDIVAPEMEEMAEGE